MAALSMLGMAQMAVPAMAQDQAQSANSPANHEHAAPAGQGQKAQPDPLDAPARAAMQLLLQHKPQEAYDMLAGPRAEVDRRVAEDRKNGLVYCAVSMTEAISYTLLGAAAKTRAKVLLPSACHVLYISAYAQSEMGHFDKGMALMEKLTDLAPQNSQYLSELGFAYQRSGQATKAMGMYERARDTADLAPTPDLVKRRKAVALRGIGYLLIDKGDLDGAEKAYRTSLEIDPGNPTATNELAVIAQRRPK
ncbi:MAG TPA: hypothetical protein VN222_17290 [Novosphingobium sp.]|nr:hypothetical protein [Novosphingobium sp.]